MRKYLHPYDKVQRHTERTWLHDYNTEESRRRLEALFRLKAEREMTTARRRELILTAPWSTAEAWLSILHDWRAIKLRFQCLFVGGRGRPAVAPQA